MQFKQSHRGRVLLADDNEDIRTIVAQLIRWEGWEVLDAADGEQALQRAVKEKPDVLVLDYRMPRMNGGKVYELMRGMGMNIPVVMISADIAADELAARCGIQHVLSKPFHCADLLSLLEELVPPPSLLANQ